MMEKNRPHIVKMTIERKETSSGLIRPDLYFVIIPARDKQRLCFMEIDTTYWTIMLFESIDQSSHPIVPQLNRRRVQCNEDPWPCSSQ